MCHLPRGDKKNSLIIRRISIWIEGRNITSKTNNQCTAEKIVLKKFQDFQNILIQRKTNKYEKFANWPLLRDLEQPHLLSKSQHSISRRTLNIKRKTVEMKQAIIPSTLKPWVSSGNRPDCLFWASSVASLRWPVSFVMRRLFPSTVPCCS